MDSFDATGRFLGSSYTYKDDSQVSFPTTNWTSLAEFSSSQGIVYTKNSANIFGYCFSKATGVILTGCQPIASCTIANCLTCSYSPN